MESLRDKARVAFKAIDIDASNSLSHQELHSVHGGDRDGFLKELKGAVDEDSQHVSVATDNFLSWRDFPSF